MGEASYLIAWQCPTFTWGGPTLSSALSVFTSEFGMGSGGSRSLLPPDKLVRNAVHLRYTAFVYSVVKRVLTQSELQTFWVLYDQASRAISTG